MDIDRSTSDPLGPEVHQVAPKRTSVGIPAIAVLTDRTVR